MKIVFESPVPYGQAELIELPNGERYWECHVEGTEDELGIITFDDKGVIRRVYATGNECGVWKVELTDAEYRKIWDHIREWIATEPDLARQLTELGRACQAFDVNDAPDPVWDIIWIIKQAGCDPER